MRPLSIIVLALVVSVKAHAGSLSVAILNIGGAKDDEAVRMSVMDTLATEMGREPALKVITRSEIESMIGLEKLKDSLGCTDQSCLAEIGGALGADRLVTGSLAHEKNPDGRDFWSLTLQWIDPKASVTLARESVTWDGTASGLYKLIPSVALKLVHGVDAQSYRGKLQVTTEVSGARVLVDGQEVGKAPLSPLSLPIGKAKVEIFADGFEPFQAQVVIDKDKTTGVLAQLIQKPTTPIYTRWWFWTIGGVIVAGSVAAITAGVLVSQRPAANPGGGNQTASGSFVVPNVPALPGAR